MSALAVVRFTQEGWHNWSGATGKREYLASRHRHLFYFEVSLEVFHNDREVEFHDLLDFCKANTGAPEFGGVSCENIAESLAKKITLRYEGRRAIVSVFEDNEVGAIVELRHTPLG